ncbi:MAG: thiol-activated cytolysin family protein [Gemmatimonadota bacterium]
MKRNATVRAARWGFYTFVLVIFAACEAAAPTMVDQNPDPEPDPDPQAETAAMAALLNNAGAFEEIASSMTETDPVEFEEQSGNDNYFCTRKTVSLTEGYSDYPQFDPNTQIIFPGNLLQGNTLDNATPSDIPVDRGPGTVVITLVNGASSASRDLDKVRLSSVYDAMNEIIADNPGDLPARTTYSMERITSREQLGVSIQAEYENLTSSVQGSFDYNSDVSMNRFLVKLTQSYYTIAFEAPTNPGNFFGPGATATQLAQYVQPGNPAAYVSSVTYGRQFYLLIQSTESVQSMEASIDASFSGAVAGGSIGSDVKYVSELESVKIGGYAIGGDAGLAAAALTGDFEALSSFIADGGTITTGAPLSYTVNAANDPARQLKVKIATEYDVVDCSPIEAALPDGVAWYRSENGVLTGPIVGAQGVAGWVDLFGAQRNDDSRNSLVPFGGPAFSGLFNPPNVVAFQFNPSSFTGRMSLPGTALLETDYTIFAVVNRTGVPPSDANPVYWIFGDSQDEGRGIRIGFDDNETVSLSHGGTTHVSGELVASIFDAQIYTFTFSQENGVHIYIDGLEVAHDPTLNTPLELFRGASMGVSDENGSPAGVGFATINMFELQIYDFVPSDAQRIGVVRGLQEFYNF